MNRLFYYEPILTLKKVKFFSHFMLMVRVILDLIINDFLGNLSSGLWQNHTLNGYPSAGYLVVSFVHAAFIRIVHLPLYIMHYVLSVTSWLFKTCIVCTLDPIRCERLFLRAMINTSVLSFSLAFSR